MLWKQGLTALFLVQATGEISVMSAVTAVLLHHSAVVTDSYCCVVSVG